VDVCLASSLVDLPRPEHNVDKCRRCGTDGDPNREFCSHHFLRFLRSRKSEIELACAYKTKVAQSLNFFESALSAEAHEDRECPICLEIMPVDETVLLVCGHLICVRCQPCLQPPRCPLCRTAIQDPRRDIVRLVAPGVRAAGQSPELQHQLGSKLAAVVSSLRHVRERYPSEKVIVFSQWEALRHQLAQALTELDIGHMLLGGNVFQRTRTLQTFQEDPEMKLLLLSLEDSASGTNLTCASHVFLVHPMLATSAEQARAFEAQAVGRVRRLGQRRPVHIWRFVTRGTIEESLWGLANSTS